MNNLKVGFDHVNINPPMGISIRSYYKLRYAEAIWDDLEVNALARTYMYFSAIGFMNASVVTKSAVTGFFGY